MTRKQIIKNKKSKRRIVELSYKLKLGHIGSCLTAVDIIEEIYAIKKPNEKFVLSSGHAHLAHAVIMAQMPMSPMWSVPYKDKTDQHSRLDERMIKDYGIHCDRQAGCDVSTGSLGHGIGIAVGMALADRSKNVYCLLSDGECAEGSVAEALRIKHDYKVDNLQIYLNDNGYGAYRETGNDIMVTDLYKINHRMTNLDDYPEWLQGQIAHYKVLNEQEYNELMEILK